MADWPPEVFPAIASVKVLNYNADPSDGKTEKVVEIRLVDQARYQELLMKHAGQLMDKLELSGRMQHEHQAGQVFVDALIEGLSRADSAMGPPATGNCPHCGGTGHLPHSGKSLSEPPAPPIDVEGGLSNLSDSAAGQALHGFPVQPCARRT